MYIIGDDELMIESSEHLNFRDAVRVMSASERMEALQSLLDRFDDVTEITTTSTDDDPWLDSKLLVISLITDWLEACPQHFSYDMRERLFAYLSAFPPA